MKAERQHKELQQADPIHAKRERSKLSFIDNRTQIAIQTKLIKLIQKKNNTDSNLIQRMVQVSVMHDVPTKKKIRAVGHVEDFKDGTQAGDEGWIGVRHIDLHMKSAMKNMKIKLPWDRYRTALQIQRLVMYWLDRMEEMERIVIIYSLRTGERTMGYIKNSKMKCVSV